MPNVTYDERVKQQIRRGVAALDKTMLDWRKDINLNTLDMSDPCRCVWGQVFVVDADTDDGFEYGRGFLEAYGSPESQGVEVYLPAVVVQYGAGAGRIMFAYDHLTTMWKGYLEGEWE